MNRKDALEEIQTMHLSELVTKRSIIGWYTFYGDKLPMMKPERSMADLTRTIALWMDLTEKGGSPAFPYHYKTNIPISDDAVKNSSPDPYLGISLLTLFVGIVMLFIRSGIGLLIIGLAISTIIMNYLIRGGSRNLDTVISARETAGAIIWLRKNYDAKSNINFAEAKQPGEKTG
jgi:hypothetical protein